MKQVWDKEFLNFISLKRLPGDSHLGIISRDQARFREYIKQINKMWRAMPDTAKVDGSLYKDLRNHKNYVNFEGKRAELLTNWVLKKLVTSEIQYEPLIEKQTPDFYFHKNSNSHIVEVLNILKSEKERKKDRVNLELRNRLKGKKANFSFIVRGNPLPNKNGSVKGLDKEILRVLRNKNLKDKEEITVDFNGASVRLSIIDNKGENLPVYCGSIGSVVSSKGVQKLNSGIKSKLDSYKFPFIISCVSNEFDIDIDSLVNTLFGHLQLSINTETLESEGTSRTGKGGWGTRSGSFSRFLRLQGVLLIKDRWEGDKLKLS
ncbi:hypothetical protein N9O57_00850, partial [bacterium]|nr:hypothetical protein [bacterium]